MNRDDLALWALRLRVMLGKELRQLLRDRVLLAFIVYAFSVDIFLAASGVSLQLNRADYSGECPGAQAAGRWIKILAGQSHPYSIY